MVGFSRRTGAGHWPAACWQPCPCACRAGEPRPPSVMKSATAKACHRANLDETYILPPSVGAVVLLSQTADFMKGTAVHTVSGRGKKLLCPGPVALRTRVDDFAGAERVPHVR